MKLKSVDTTPNPNPINSLSPLIGGGTRLNLIHCHPHTSPWPGPCSYLLKICPDRPIIPLSTALKISAPTKHYTGRPHSRLNLHGLCSSPKKNHMRVVNLSHIIRRFHKESRPKPFWTGPKNAVGLSWFRPDGVGSRCKAQHLKKLNIKMWPAQTRIILY